MTTKPEQTEISEQVDAVAGEVKSSPATDTPQRRGILSKPIRIGSTGFTRRAGVGISKGEIPDHLWDAMVAEGVIKFPERTPVNPKTLARRGRQSKKKVIK